MKKTELATVVSVLLGEKAIACEDHGPNKVLVKLAEINQEIYVKELCNNLYKELLTQNYEEVAFDFYDVNNLLIVRAIKNHNEFEEPRLTTVVLSHFANNVVEYENNYPNSISIRLENCINQDDRISICNEVSEVLKIYDFENISFENAGNWLTIFAKDTIEYYPKKSKLTTVVLTLLQDVVEEYKEFSSDLIAINVINYDIKLHDKEMTTYIKDTLMLQGFTDIKFTIYQDSSLRSYWLIVEAQEPQDDAEELSGLAFSVLTLLGNNVYEYGQFYSDSISVQLFDGNKKLTEKKCVNS